MAADHGGAKQKKSKIKYEEKKRKHGEVEADEPVLSKKKSKLGLDSASQPSSNGKAVQHQMDSLTLGNHQKSVTSNGSYLQTVDSFEVASPAPRKKKDKSKHSQTDDLKDDEPVLTQESSQLPSASKKKSKKKSKSHDKTNVVASQVNNTLSAPAGNNDTMAMDIDTQEPQPLNYSSDTPYIRRSIEDVLHGKLPSSSEENKASPFIHQPISLYVALSPIGLTTPLVSACAEHLAPLCLKYYPPVQGVVLCYANPRFQQEQGGSSGNPTSQALAISRAEYAAPMAWLEAELLLFKPARGHKVEGVIVLQNESHIGLQVYNFFSGHISRQHLPQNWKWSQAAKSKHRSRKGILKGGNGEPQNSQQMDIDTSVAHDDEGHWIDGKGKKVEGLLEFWVWDVEIALGVREAEGNLPTIEGTLRVNLLKEDDDDVPTSRQVVKKGKKKA